MGGNAVKTVPLTRLKKTDYEKVASTILGKLKSHFPSADFRIVPAYHDKLDFGDVDILYAFNTSEEQSAFYEKALDILGATPCEAKRNGPVLSIAHQVGDGQYFQVDLIKSMRCTIDFAEFYYGFNDIGYVLGRVARFLGMKMGDRGLYYPLRKEGDPTQVISDILVTRNIAEALDLLGYRIEDYQADRFSTRKDIFTFLSGGKWFSREMLLASNQNHKWRKRQKSRPVYQDFLEHLDLFCGDREFTSYEKRYSLRALVLQRLLRIENFKYSYLQAQIEQERYEAFSRRYNGGVVSEITGLKDGDLGRFMKSFKGNLTKTEFQDWVMEMSDDQMKNTILSHVPYIS